MKLAINKNKTGISRETIAIIIFILAVVILILWMNGTFKGFFGKTKEQVCHSQIMARHTFNLGIDVGRKAIPLSSCQADHICFVKNEKEDCPELAGLSDIEKIKINTQDEIIEGIANRMQTCWWMVGEGNLDYEPEGWDFGQVYCGICAKIAFSSEVNSEIGQIKFKRLYDYMETNTIKNGEISYLQYLYNKDSLDDVRKMIRTEAENKEDFKQAGGGTDIYEYYLDTADGYAIITGIDKPGHLDKVVGAIVGGAIATALTISSAGIGTVVLISGGAAVGGASIVTIFSEKGTKVIPPQLVVYDKEHKEILDKIGCDTSDFLP